MVIVGADISINSTGLVKFYDATATCFDWCGFTNVIKTQKIYPCNMHLVPKNFNTYLDKSMWMNEIIMDFCKDADYIAIENYSFGSKSGLSFHIGGFTEILKMNWYMAGKKIRIYDIVEIKKTAVGKSNAEKYEMVNKFEENHDDLKLLHDDSIKSMEKSPLTDIVDAYFIANMLNVELKLRNGSVLLKDLPDNMIWAFNRTTKSNEENILCRPFLQK
jgi:Holliday junction resolvasome RuvABC endonuclease subunit